MEGAVVDPDISVPSVTEGDEGQGGPWPVAAPISLPGGNTVRAVHAPYRSGLSAATGRLLLGQAPQAVQSRARRFWKKVATSGGIEVKWTEKPVPLPLRGCRTLA